MHFNHPDPKVITDVLVQKCEFMESRDRTATFALAVYLKALPGELISIYVVVIVVLKVAEREKRRIREQQEKVRVNIVGQIRCHESGSHIRNSKVHRTLTSLRVAVMTLLLVP